MHQSASKDISVTFQLNADCSDDVPPDYETSVGGPPTNPISGASDITVNESSVVLDPTGRTIGLQQLHPDEETELQAGESRVIASSEYTDTNHTFLTYEKGFLLSSWEVGTRLGPHALQYVCFFVSLLFNTDFCCVLCFKYFGIYCTGVKKKMR